MDYKFIGKTGVKVSSLCFGTMSFGGDADKETSRALFACCRDKGINFFDCADIYQNGIAEEILGECIAGSRDQLVLTSKVYFQTGKDINACGSSRRHILSSINASLKRLKTDYLDFYFIHRFDDYTPLEETLKALDDLVRAGKILYPAASNYAAWQITKALGISSKEGLARFECIQPMYNLIKRQAEVELFPMAESEKLGVITYSPLGGGLLTGKYISGQKPAVGRLVNNERYELRYAASWIYDTADKFVHFAQKRGLTPPALAVAWAASHPAITAPIIGARNLNQLTDCLKSLEIKMTPELRLEIANLSIEPPTATDRDEERLGERFIGRL